MAALSGLWLGQRDGEVLRWSLSLTESQSFPSAFGGSAIEGDCTTNLLVGTWKPEEALLSLRESLVTRNEESDLLYHYTMRLVTPAESLDGKQEMPYLIGMWESGSTNESGRVVCRKEIADSEIHVSGLWVGQAVPDDSLKDFYLPVNPIGWSLTVLRRSLAQRMSCPVVFGCGYFDDAADIKDQPILCFTLSASEFRDCAVLDRDENESISSMERFALAKVYEFSKETDGVLVLYSCRLSLSTSGTFSIEGSWENKWGGSFGQFNCTLLDDMNSYSTHQVFCNSCNQPILCNDEMWECSICPEGWTACKECYSDIIHSHSLVKETRYKNECAKGDSCASVALNALYSFSKRPFLGFKEGDLYQWTTYEKVGAKVLDMWAGLEKLIQERNLPRGNCLIVGELNEDYIVSMLSCLLSGLVLVPVDGNLDSIGVEHVISISSPTIYIIEERYYNSFETSLRGDYLVVIINSQGSSNLKGENEKLFFYSDLFNTNYSIADLHQRLLHQNAEEDDLVAILFTSGSSGYPKGAAYTEKLALPSFSTANVEPLVRFDFQSFHPSFIISLLSIMRCGGRRAIATDLGCILDNIELARPTHISAPPVLFQMLYEEYQCKINRLTRENDTEERRVEIAKQVRNKMGNRLVSVASGGASLPPTILHFCNHVLDLNLADLYGSRETGPIAMNGIVYSSVEVDILPLDDRGNQHQGEIIVHSPRLISSYVNEPEKTDSAFLLHKEKRFYRTGDFGEVFQLDGSTRVRVLGRVGFTVKMIQGEWISPDRIEAIIEGSSWIDQIIVFATETHSYTVAIVVPSKRILDICEDPFSHNNVVLCEQRILQELQFWCTHHHVKHTPQKIALSAITWTPDNGFLTPTLKKRRRVFHTHYRELVDQLFEIPAVTNENFQWSPIWKQHLQDTFPSLDEFPEQLTLTQLGANSLQIARLSSRLKKGGIEIQMRDLFDYSLSHLNGIIGNRENHLPIVPREIEWELDCLLEKISPIERKNGSSVLLTGCTGFLGPVLLGEILIAYPQSPVYCLVRGRNQLEAKQRLLSHLQAVGDQRYPLDSTLTSRVKVVLGDLQEPLFGVTSSQWDEIESSLGTIFHNGAIVNVLLPYASLRQVNVESTRFLIQMAARTGASLEYISSVNVLSEFFHEEQWLPPNYRVTAGGYATSKVVSERLLQQASERGVKLHVHRVSTIAGHTESGYFNMVDFTGILIGVCVSLEAAVCDSPMSLQWIPVDTVAKAIIRISQQDNPSTDQRVFHFCGEAPRFSEVIEVLQNMGYPIQPVSVDQWGSLVKEIPESHKHFSLLPVISQLTFTQTHYRPSTDKTNAFLYSLGISPVPITNTHIERYMTYLSRHHPWKVPQ